MATTQGQETAYALIGARGGVLKMAYTLRGTKNELEHEFPLVKQVSGKLQTNDFI
jgi:hypothetical protein